MSFFATVVLPALLPAIGDGIRGVFAKFTKGAGGQPQNVAERIQLMQAESERLKALAEIDRPNENISRWVADLRASFRYIAVGVIWLVTGLVIFIPDTPELAMVTMLDVAGATTSFIIGERMYFKLGK